VKDSYDETVKQYKEGNVLDVGAGAKKPLYTALKKKIQNGKYYSMDSDDGGEFDFISPDHIPESLRFSLIVANQFFEHLSPDASLDIAKKLFEKTAPGGKFIATIPNISHPNRYWGDITHVTHWNYNNIYMVFKYAGYDITKIARYSKRHPQGIMEKIITHYVSRVYRMDWCDSILLVAQKKNG
jgi:hypothetical protein